MKMENNVRISKDLYYLNIAKEVAKRSTCMRRRFGAVIVNQDQIISTGYAGSPRKTKNCIEIGLCLRTELKLEHGHNYELCRSVHAEQNAIIHASRLDMIGGSLYLVSIKTDNDEVPEYRLPCMLCKRMIINAGLEEVVVLGPNQEVKKFAVFDWVQTDLGELALKDGQLQAKFPNGY